LRNISIRSRLAILSAEIGADFTAQCQRETGSVVVTAEA
jgi:hypothetical protein